MYFLYLYFSNANATVEVVISSIIALLKTGSVQWFNQYIFTAINIILDSNLLKFDSRAEKKVLLKNELEKRNQEPR